VVIDPAGDRFEHRLEGRIRIAAHAVRFVIDENAAAAIINLEQLVLRGDAGDHCIAHLHYHRTPLFGRGRPTQVAGFERIDLGQGLAGVEDIDRAGDKKFGHVGGRGAVLIEITGHLDLIALVESGICGGIPVVGEDSRPGAALRLAKSEFNALASVAEAGRHRDDALDGHSVVEHITEIPVVLGRGFKQIAVAHLLDALQTGIGSLFHHIVGQARLDLGIAVGEIEDAGDRLDRCIVGGKEIVLGFVVDPAGAGAVIDLPLAVAEVGIGDGGGADLDEATLVGFGVGGAGGYFTGCHHHRGDPGRAGRVDGKLGHRGDLGDTLVLFHLAGQGDAVALGGKVGLVVHLDPGPGSIGVLNIIVVVLEGIDLAGDHAADGDDLSLEGRIAGGIRRVLNVPNRGDRRPGGSQGCAQQHNQ